MIKKIICVGVVIVMLVALVMLVAIATYEPAPEKKGDFYTLQEAYDQGLITLDDLKSIAYYQNGGSEDESFVPIPKTPEVLSEKTEKAIKETRAYDARNQSQLPHKDATPDKVNVKHYYGTYNNCVAVMITDMYAAYDASLWKITVEGVLFCYADGNRILIWKEKQN